jgi:dTDP-4-dehydrorhamnose reductase
MRILVLGGSGLLGTQVLREFSSYDVDAPSSTELDITDPTAVATIAQGDWSAVINCAAFTGVDLAETERDAAYDLNALAPGYVATACALADVPMVYISTDFVFDGGKGAEYTEEDVRAPLGVYGETKSAGEDAVLSAGADAYILRTAWLFGPDGKCFPRTILNAYRAGKNLKVVSDQFGSPTSTRWLASVIRRIVEQRPEPGIYHAAGGPTMSWFDLAGATLRACEPAFDPTRLAPCGTEEYPTPAARPRFSALNCEKLGAAGLAPPFELRADLRMLAEG